MGMVPVIRMFAARLGEIDAGPLGAELDRLVPEDAILATNTSAIPITRIASATRRPDRVVGVHFMNPVPHKRVAIESRLTFWASCPFHISASDSCVTLPRIGP